MGTIPDYKTYWELRKKRVCIEVIAEVFEVEIGELDIYKIRRPSKYAGALEGLTGRDRKREEVRIRDKQTCQSCGKKWKKGMRKFDCHHLNGLCGKMSRAYDKDISIMITLCHKCHFNYPQHASKL